MMECTFSRLGCEFRGLKEEMDIHLQDDFHTHLQLVAINVTKNNLKSLETYNTIDRLGDNLESHKTAFQTLKQKCEQNSRKLDSCRNDIKLFKIKSAGLTERIISLERKVQDLPTNVDVEHFNSEVQKLSELTNALNTKVQRLEQAQGQESSQNKTLTAVTTLERQVGIQDVKLAEFDLRLQVQETVSYDGILIWKIKDYARRKNEARTGKTLSLYSQPFYTSRYGYKMCARVYLNGDGMGKGTHLSLFFVVMKGEFDALLSWPFKQKVSLYLLSQDGSSDTQTDSFRPDAKSSSFQRPQSDMNIAAGCPTFVPHNVVESSKYLRDDAIFLKVTVDVSGLHK